jgi:hypothetical protein
MLDDESSDVIEQVRKHIGPFLVKASLLPGACKQPEKVREVLKVITYSNQKIEVVKYDLGVRETNFIMPGSFSRKSSKTAALNRCSGPVTDETGKSLLEELQEGCGWKEIERRRRARAQEEDVFASDYMFIQRGVVHL